MRRLLTVMIGLFFTIVISRSGVFAADVNVGQLFGDLKIVEAEEAKAREVRLKWITDARDRIQNRLGNYNVELQSLRRSVPDPVKISSQNSAGVRAQKREKLAFETWAANNDPALNAAIMKGSGINALLRVLGPIAHYRKLQLNPIPRGNNNPAQAPVIDITVADASHFRMVPATSAGSNVVVRLNKMPLDLQWSPILVQEWPAECRDILKLRDEYVAVLNVVQGNDTAKLVDRAEVLDSSLELLQAMALKKKWMTPKNPALSSAKKVQVHRDLQDAIRYLETVRATAERLKAAPGEFRVYNFEGGSTEDFLDFTYVKGMIFQEARPDDQSDYFKVYRLIQDYARAVLDVESCKQEIAERMEELNEQDKKLLWFAASASGGAN